MAMQWIERHAFGIRIGATAAVLVAAGVLLFARSFGSNDFTPWRLALVVLPWLGFFACFLPLIYRSWFGTRRPVLVTVVGQAFFWLLAIALLAIFVQIYGGLVLSVW